jgi:hypothetical protein
MEIGSLATFFAAGQAAQTQLAVAAKLLRMNADMARSAVQLLDAAKQNADQMAATAAGIGGNLDTTV